MKVSYCTLNMRQAAVQRPSTESLFYQFWGIPRKKNIASVVFRRSYIVKVFTNNSSHRRCSPRNVPKYSEQLFLRTLSKFMNL